ncbi:type I-D CRISPR-associated helicase Cas3 [Phormidium willei BDU 130791]|nr:type I-D CRISPR-associated helicase Cas3 [Phormidium willei BDU 130791]
MKLALQPLFSQLNPNAQHCPLGCAGQCKVRSYLTPPAGADCPLSTHQVETAAELLFGEADVIFNCSATGDGKTLGASLPSLLDRQFRVMGLYPTIELVEDQTRQQRHYHQTFQLDASERIDRLYGEELSRRVSEEESSRMVELMTAIKTKPILLTNPDIFHLIAHYRYRDPAYGTAELICLLAEFPDVWVFDEFHIFGPHEETAALNIMMLIRQMQTGRKRFLFTSATPRDSFLKQLQQAQLQCRQIQGTYCHQPTTGYRAILQGVNLEVVQAEDVVQWLDANAAQLRQHLLEDGGDRPGRGLVVLNAIAKVHQAVSSLCDRLPDIDIVEISGRIDRQERETIRDRLADETATTPVLVIATSAVDVGVDFQIHLLVFESSNAATTIQRLGRLGRHPGFDQYHAYLLTSAQTPWQLERLQEELAPELATATPISRDRFNQALEHSLELPQAFDHYRRRWGPLQAQGLLAQIAEDKFTRKVSEPLRQRLSESFQTLWGDRVPDRQRPWYALKNSSLGKAIQDELLRFRGGSALQIAVWDDSGPQKRFYTYDLLRLLPVADIELIDREAFFNQARPQGFSSNSFPERFLRGYVRLRTWRLERSPLELSTGSTAGELDCCQLSQLRRLRISQHCDLSRQLSRQAILCFLIPVDKGNRRSHWTVFRRLKLPPTFGLYRLNDADSNSYACGFDRDALLLEALKPKLADLCRRRPTSLIF